MVITKAPSAQLLRSLRALATEIPSSRAGYSTTNYRKAEIQAQREGKSYYAHPDPETVLVPHLEKRLSRAGTPPVGSRRHRAASLSSSKVPFDQLPFQCFQEARKVLIGDRQEKLEKIEQERARLARVQATEPDFYPGGEAFKQRKIRSLQDEIEHLKILADINDPNVKRRFEDGKGDMNKPIYRFLANRKWREYNRNIQLQRITQMKIAPDVIPQIDPIVEVKLAFGKRSVPSGDFVDSAISERPCRLSIQSFEKGEKMVTIVVVDPDVPNLETDSFDNRCHFLASNIVITPTSTHVDLSRLSPETQVMLPWFPPSAVRGAPYHRIAVVVLQQKDNIPIDLEVAMRKVQRDSLAVRSLMSRHMLTPIGAALFRTKWDDNMASVMARAGLEGTNVELKRKKVEPLPYKRRDTRRMRG